MEPKTTISNALCAPKLKTIKVYGKMPALWVAENAETGTTLFFTWRLGSPPHLAIKCPKDNAFYSVDFDMVGVMKAAEVGEQNDASIVQADDATGKTDTLRAPKLVKVQDCGKELGQGILENTKTGMLLLLNSEVEGRPSFLVKCPSGMLYRVDFDNAGLIKAAESGTFA